MAKFIFLPMLLMLFACQSGSRPSESQSTFGKVELVTPAGDKISTHLAVTLSEQEQGLSGVKPEDFGDNEGMLFFYTEAGEKYFWMPDTYFDLDLFYLDENLQITDIVRKLPHYKGRANPDLIPRARAVWARHVLEMKSSSPIASRLTLGQKLEWKGSDDLKVFEKKALQKLQISP